MKAHQFDARGRQGRKPNSDSFFFSRLKRRQARYFFFFETKTKASTVVRKGEECVPCDPGYELRKGGSLTKLCAENTRGRDRKKNASMHECISYGTLFGACIDRLGDIPSNNNNP